MKLLTVDDVAELLKVSTRHVWKLLSAGRFPQPIRIGRSVRWRRADVENWIDDGCPRVGMAE
jgi:excisionase family DNA binding protein